MSTIKYSNYALPTTCNLKYKEIEYTKLIRVHPSTYQVGLEKEHSLIKDVSVPTINSFNLLHCDGHSTCRSSGVRGSSDVLKSAHTRPIVMADEERERASCTVVCRQLASLPNIKCSLSIGLKNSTQKSTLFFD